MNIINHPIAGRIMPATDLSGMTDQEWSAYRKASIHIGGSEVGAILNLNPYQDALSLWAKKIGFIEDDFIPSEASEGGHMDEDAIIQRLEMWDGHVWAAHRRTGQRFRKIEKPTVTFLPPAAPYMALNVDGLIENDKDYPGYYGVAEAKKINGISASRYSMGVPPYYIAQLCAYIHFLGLDFGRIALLEDGVKLNVRTIDRGMPEYEEFIKHFWRLPKFFDAIQEGRDLMASDMSAEEKRSEVLELLVKYNDILYVTDRSKSMIDGLRSENPYSTIQSPALDGVAAKIKQLDAEKKRIEKDIEQLKNQVRLAMEKVGADLIQGDKYRILNKKYLTITENR
jgi:hypothetical protein